MPACPGDRWAPGHQSDRLRFDYEPLCPQPSRIILGFQLPEPRQVQAKHGIGWLIALRHVEKDAEIVTRLLDIGAADEFNGRSDESSGCFVSLRTRVPRYGVSFSSVNNDFGVSQPTFPGWRQNNEDV